MDRSEEIVIQPRGKVAVAASVVDASAAAEATPQTHIQVAEQLRRPHPLIQDVSVVLAEARIDDRGMRRSRVGNSTSPKALEVRVSPASRNRAPRLLDAPVKAPEIRVREHPRTGH
jgi:hypothetical protein